MPIQKEMTERMQQFQTAVAEIKKNVRVVPRGTDELVDQALNSFLRMGGSKESVNNVNKNNITTLAAEFAETLNKKFQESGLEFDKGKFTDAFEKVLREQMDLKKGWFGKVDDKYVPNKVVQA